MTRDEAILRCASARVLNADDITSLNYRTQPPRADDEDARICLGASFE